MADNVILPASGTGDATPKVATDQLAGGEHVQYVKLMDGAADSSAKIGGDATNGLKVNVTKQAETQASTSVANWTSATGVDTALDVAVAAYASVSVTIQIDAGSITGGVVAFMGSVDGGSTYPAGVGGIDSSQGWDGSGAAAIRGGALLAWKDLAEIGSSGGQRFVFNVAGLTHFRVLLNPAITGTATVTITVLPHTAPATIFAPTPVTFQGAVPIAAWTGSAWQALAVDSSGNLTVVGKAADGAAVSGNPVLMAGQDGTNVQSIKTDTTGRVEVIDGGQSITVDAPTATPVNVQIGDGILQATVRDTGASDSLNVSIVDASGNQITSFGGTQYTEDAAAAADPVGGQLIARRRDTLTATEVSNDGDVIALNATAKGELYIQQPFSANTSETISTVTSSTPLAVSGFTQAGMQITPTSATYTVAPQVSWDGGSTWVATNFIAAGKPTSSIAVTTSSVVQRQGIMLPGGVTHVRLAFSVFSAGSANVVVVVSNATEQPGLYASQQPGSAVPTAVLMMGGSDGTNAQRIKTDTSGNVQTADTQTITDNAAFTDGTSKVLMAGYAFDETAGTALTENDAAAARIDSKRAQVLVLEDATTRGQRAAVSSAGAVSASAGQLPHSVGVTMATAAARYTTTQTSTNLVAGTGGQRIYISHITVATGGTAAVRVSIYWGTGAFSSGTSPTVFDGEFAPSATVRPGWSMSYPIPIGGVSATGDNLRVTTDAAGTVYVTVHYYKV